MKPTPHLRLTLALFLLSAPAMALERQSAATGAQELAFQGASTLSRLNAALVGEGVAGVAARQAPVSTGRIAWRVIRDETDELGMRHVFYRQYLLPSGKLGDAVEGNYAKDGIELAGGEIGVHFGADGALQTVFGTQFRGVEVTNALAVDRAWDAYQATQAALATYPEFSPLDWSTLASDTVTAQLAETKLLLMSSGDGYRFTLVWEVPVVDRDWASYAAYLGASTGAIVKLERRGAEALCSPTKGTSSSATGYSQGGCNSPRSLWAAAASDRGPNFTHEAFRFAGSHIPDLEIYFGLPSNDPNYSTYMCPGKLYGVLPLKTVSGVVSYDDWTVGAAIPGDAYPLHSGCLKTRMGR